MKKKFPVFLIAVIIVLIGAVIGLLNVYKQIDEPYDKYNTAVEYANKGDYITAISMFRNLGQFNDSRQKLREIIDHLNYIDIPSDFDKFSHADTPIGINEKYGVNGENTLFGTQGQFRKEYKQIGILKSYLGNVEFTFNEGLLDSLAWSSKNVDKSIKEDILLYLSQMLGQPDSEKEQTFSDGSTGTLTTWSVHSITLTVHVNEDETFNLSLDDVS